MTTVREIIAQWLRENGYDGLWTLLVFKVNNEVDEITCHGCGTPKKRLFDCGMKERVLMCQPGYLQEDGTIGPEKQESEEGDGR